jgi:hypothetical protein
MPSLRDVLDREPDRELVCVDHVASFIAARFSARLRERRALSSALACEREREPAPT